MSRLTCSGFLALNFFGTKFDPGEYQKYGNKNNFDKFYFSSDKPTRTSDLFVTANGNLPTDFEVVDTINYPNNDLDLLIGHPKQNE
ncbi:MAG: hypothetical protein UT84_C0026G0002 [Candidatus Curtissbacteria bacterium GW2011_GWA1_40_16]|uniref:Uncharacterized protein n=1 Tax=Candidatus Curtissbacteria bacterium GW2011_GWA1_40_16 TaxID=1618405 RepID=A0A0G0UH25_9BACT|nr:MAG: hypothetical protein UT84_C0026G0002 [Candidatus Curtissbacteria bacterium GW2011_GWA1_40_16]